MTRDATTAFARTLVDEWVRHGVTDACLAPGSRSAPLALALAADDRIRLHVHLDERSASFFALGLAAATGRPALLLCTSGTAAANFHPAVLEAHHARVPMIVCTADRPPELRDTGAGQTIDQVKLYGDAVRWFHEANVPDDRRGGRRVAGPGVARGGRRRVGPPAGPGAPQPAVPRAAGPDRRAARRRSGSLRRPPVDRPRPGRARRRSRCSTRSRTSSPTATRVGRRRLGRRRAGGDHPALRRGRRVAGARRPDLEPAGARHHLDLRPAAARPGVRGRAPARPRAARRWPSPPTSR